MLISVYEKLSLWGITIHPIFLLHPIAVQRISDMLFTLGGKVKIIDRKKNLVAVLAAAKYIPYIYPIYLYIIL